MKARILLAAVVLGLILFFVRRENIRRENTAVPFVEAHLAMGTVVAINLYMEEEEARPLAALAFAEIDRLDSLMSHYSPASELNRINRLATEKAVTCSPELSTVLERSQHFARRSGGVFDITIGVLTRLWNFPDARVPPRAGQIDSALALTGCEYLQLQEGRVRLLRQGMRLDLGGVAKGYAVDRAVALLQEVGVPCGLITAGGDIRFWGEKPDGRPWRFAVQHPRESGQAIEVEDLQLAALATSGDYEQSFEHEGERFHHLLDPGTGYPAHRAVSATVWTKTAMDADILSTAVFVLGPERGVEWVETLPETEALVFFEREGQLEYQASSYVAKRLHFIDKVGIDSVF